MIGSLASLPEIILRSTVVYLALIIAFRVAGKRHISQLTIIDFTLVLLVSNAVQNAMVGTDSSLTGGIVAAITLILINVTLTKVIFKNENLGKIFKGVPTLLMSRGVTLPGNLAREDIRQDELEEAIREHGISDTRSVETAVLELDGSISIIAREKEGVHKLHILPPIQKRRRGRRINQN
jgi:uncharacterized membrane protein YcaP (DUF421 family)